MSRLLNRIKKFKDANGSDIAIALVAVLLAFSLWLIQNLSLNYSAVVSVSVTASSNLDGYANESSNTSVISARCRTTGYSLMRYHRSEKKPIMVFFDPHDLTKKEDEIFSVENSDLAGYVNDIFGDNVQLESFISQSVQFRFPKENNKKVPVYPVTDLSFKDQFAALSPMAVSPDSILVYGEPFHLQNVDKVFTEPISLGNLHNSAHGTVKLEKISGIRFSDDIVAYSLDVTRYIEVPADVHMTVRNAPSGKSISVYPSTAHVVYKCAFPLTVDPSEGDYLYIDWNDFNSSINGRCVPRDRNLPSGVISYTVEPQVFEVVENGRR